MTLQVCAEAEATQVPLFTCSPTFMQIFTVYQSLSFFMFSDFMRHDVKHCRRAGYCRDLRLNPKTLTSHSKVFARKSRRLVHTTDLLVDLKVTLEVFKIQALTVIGNPVTVCTQ